MYFSDILTLLKCDDHYSRQAKLPAAVTTTIFMVKLIILGTLEGECFMSPFNCLQF